MPDPNSHLSDQELALAADGELTGDRVRHLADCLTCRTRQRQLELALTEAARLHGAELPPSALARRRLQERLAAMASQPAAEPAWHWRAAAAALVCALGIGTLYLHSHRRPEVPSRRLTPGAARSVNREQLCRSALPKNQGVPADLRQRVFQTYGLTNADPRQYEVDYLITPALGGADDIRNLWPEPYVSTVWNARVKDELEDRLHDLVCGGQLDLAEAQRDIATDWIAAYKKYFATDQPVR